MNHFVAFVLILIFILNPNIKNKGKSFLTYGFYVSFIYLMELLK